MATKILASLSLSLGLCLPAWASDSHTIPQGATFSTRVKTELVVEGLTGDHRGNLYTVGRNAGAGRPCPVWRIALASPSPVVVGFVPAPGTGQCSPSGLAFNASGSLFISEADKVYTLTPDVSSPPTATVFASGVPGTNGLAFDRDGHLWTGDGTTGLGRVWKITPAGTVTEMFRVQPMRNSVAVGRQALTFPVGAAQDLVANGLAFNESGDLFIADTARGAIWKVDFDRHGNVVSPTNCDTTFEPTAKTLCLENILVTHPLLEGADGIALDRAGNIWVAANERNAIVVVTRRRQVAEVFRNAPDPVTKLRNGGPNVDVTQVLEFPTSPFLSGDTFCTANSDNNRRDNSPNGAGEISGAGQFKGKISCMDRQLTIPGLPLPL